RRLLGEFQAALRDLGNDVAAIDLRLDRLEKDLSGVKTAPGRGSLTAGIHLPVASPPSRDLDRDRRASGDPSLLYDPSMANAPISTPLFGRGLRGTTADRLVGVRLFVGDNRAPGAIAREGRIYDARAIAPYISLSAIDAGANDPFHRRDGFDSASVLGAQAG